MKISGNGGKKAARQDILANFQFYIDENLQAIHNGITTEISDSGFGFFTTTLIRKGQTITVTKHSLRDYNCPKAKVTFVKKCPSCLEVTAKFNSRDSNS